MLINSLGALNNNFSAILRIIAIILISFSSISGRAEIIPDYERGTRIYVERCTVCHGNYGLGEGVIPLLISGYANTNLLHYEERHFPEREKLLTIIKHGGSLPNISEFMPPWKYELTLEELNAVTDFVLLLHKENLHARQLIDKISSDMEPSQRSGRNIYVSRCVLCHGIGGQGDGKLSRIIKSPPPYDLTLSGLPDKMLMDIITKGGEAVNRSPSMPAWGDELNKHELKSVILYIKSFRRKAFMQR